jgi:hypothetical protein
MPRGYDTEVKILENYAQGLPLDATGTINLYTQRAPCFSCQGVIQQFQNRYPGISLVITSGGD